MTASGAVGTPPDIRAVRVAVCGKGGSGKTALVTLLARQLRRRGVPVLAVDLDTSPGLALSFGLAPDEVRLPAAVVEPDATTTYGHSLARHLDPTAVARERAATAADGTRVIGFGDVDAVAHGVAERFTAVATIFARFDGPGWVVLGDMEPGPARPFEGLARPADLALVLAEATTASCWSAQRILSVLRSDGVHARVVVNRARAEDDIEFVRRHLPEDEVWGAVPDDPAVVDAERDGSLLALSASAPAATACDALADRIRAQTALEVPGWR